MSCWSRQDLLKTGFFLKEEVSKEAEMLQQQEMTRSSGDKHASVQQQQKMQQHQKCQQRNQSQQSQQSQQPQQQQRKVTGPKRTSVALLSRAMSAIAEVASLLVFFQDRWSLLRVFEQLDSRRDVPHKLHVMHLFSLFSRSIPTRFVRTRQSCFGERVGWLIQ